MAYERSTTEKVKGDSLDSFISNLGKTLDTQVAQRNAEDEANFNKMVLENNFTLEQQLSYRQEQLKRVADDPAEKRRIRGEISNLKQRIEQKTYSDAYLAKLTEFSSGMASIDSVINWLEGQKTTTSNTTVLDNINQQLSTLKTKKFDLTQTILKNQTEYAKNDKSESVINGQIDKVNDARAKALLAGDEATVTALDLQLQGLTQAKTQTAIENKIKNFAVSSITGFASAVQLLDAYNSQVNSSDANSGPVTIGGVTYTNAKEFWTYKRDSYLNDSSEKGFFYQFNNEVNTKVKTLASQNNLDVNKLSDMSKQYDTLRTRPELAGYEGKIDTYKQDSLQTGANSIGNKIVNDYAVNLDVGKAVSSLSNLGNLGVATSDFYTKILTAAASTKTQQVNSILAAAQTALQNDPSLTPQAALEGAVKSGAGLVLSPEQLASMSETDIAKNATDTATKGTGTNDTRTTIPGANPPAANNGAPATPASTGNFSNYVIKAGDTLGKIAQQFGTTVDALASTNGIANPNMIQAGATLKIPTGSTTPAPAATPTPTPAAQNNSTTTPATSTTTPKTTTPAPAPAPQPVQQNTPPAPKPVYQGSSIVDYLASTGQDTSYSARSKLAASKGITGYTGTAAQNTQLLKTLRGF